MNGTHFNQIVTHYIEQFEYLNNETNGEYYKWEIAGKFRTAMDAALSASDEELPKALYAAKKLSWNLIDSRTQPFSGLAKFAEKEPETVRRMFLDLYADDGGNVAVKQKKAQAFLDSSHALRDRYFPGSFLYNDDYHSVSGYAFLYDPDHNYLYKYDQAIRFANCIEFMEDWGYGANTRLDVFYRMCDEVVARIQEMPDLLKTNASRFDTKVFSTADQFHPDRNKHILCFDLLYCSTVYGLFHGISFQSIPTKERILFAEKVKKAQELKAEYDRVKEQESIVNDLVETIKNMLSPGTKVKHKTFGDGVLIQIDAENMVIEFDRCGEKTLGIIATLGGGFLRTGDEAFDSLVLQNKSILLDAQKIPSRIREAERKLIPYTEYLE